MDHECKILEALKRDLRYVSVPHVIRPILENFKDGKGIYFGMEQRVGFTMVRFVEENGCLDEHSAKNIIRSLVAGLHFMQSSTDEEILNIELPTPSKPRFFVPRKDMVKTELDSENDVEQSNKPRETIRRVQIALCALHVAEELIYKHQKFNCPNRNGKLNADGAYFTASKASDRMLSSLSSYAQVCSAQQGLSLYAQLVCSRYAQLALNERVESKSINKLFEVLREA